MEGNTNDDDNGDIVDLVSAWDTVIPEKDIEIEEKLGGGAFGKVYRVRCRGVTLAMKTLRKRLEGTLLEDLKRELSIMRLLRSQSVVMLVGLCELDDGGKALLMEYVPGRDLNAILNDPLVDLSTEQKLRITKEIALGCNWLHRLTPPIVHRDLKPDNVLVSADLKQVKLCDFGLSCIQEDITEQEIKGSPLYMAPERFFGASGDEKSDVYSFALTIWELFEKTDRPFAYVETFEDLIEVVHRQKKRPNLQVTPEPIARVIRKCWAPDPKDRPDFTAILNMLDDAILEVLIPDPNGRELWCMDLDIHYPFGKQWSLLKNLLNELMEDEGLDETILDPLRLHVVEENHDLIRSKKKAIASAEKFGRFLEVFGPLSYKNLVKYTSMCVDMYYHGDISSAVAKERLLDENEGAFLVRLSSDRGCLTLSIRGPKGSCKHVRIVKTQQGYATSFGEKEIAEYSTVQELLRKTAKRFRLTTPCTRGSPFAALFVPEPRSDEYIIPGKFKE